MSRRKSSYRFDSYSHRDGNLVLVMTIPTVGAVYGAVNKLTELSGQGYSPPYEGGVAARQRKSREATLARASPIGRSHLEKVVAHAQC